MLKIIELWLFRRLERLLTLHRLRAVQQAQFKTIFLLVARFRLQVDSPNITQCSRKWLMQEQVHLPLQTPVALPTPQMMRILESLMPMATFHLITMTRPETRIRNQPVKVPNSLLKRPRTVQSVTTSLVSTEQINVYLRNETLQNA